MLSENTEFIEKIVTLKGEKHWEGRIEFDDFHAIASQVFNSVVKKCKDARMPILPRILMFFNFNNVVESTDPNVTVTLKRSEWNNIYEILKDLDIEILSIAYDDDKRLQSILVLKNILMNKGG